MKVHQTIFSLILFAAFAATTQIAVAQKQSFPSDSYKCFTGTVAGKPVQVYLTSLEGRINGWYSSDNNRDQIPLSFAPQYSNDSIFVLSEWSAGDGNTADTTLWYCGFYEGVLTGETTQTGRQDASVNQIRLKEDYPAGTYPFAIKSFSNTYDAFAGKDATPQWECDYVYPVCTKEDPNGKWINSQIKGLLQGDPNLDFDQIIAKTVRQRLKEYRTDMEGMDSDMYGPSTKYQSMLQIYIDFNKNDYLIFNTDIYDFMGGAHGNYADLYTCYDVRHKKQLPLADLLIADSITLQKLIEGQYRLDNHLKEGEELTALYDHQIPTTKNFYFNTIGVAFIYNPYEIAPYVLGTIKVLIPYKKLSPYLNPEFKSRMQVQ